MKRGPRGTAGSISIWMISMSHLDGYEIECPCCGYKARGSEYDPSLCDECFCPKCGSGFVVDVPDD